MSLRILFADDSVTAQNMGKKILTEAGYEVVAVSNGAAAVKKIAEQKPDIIILDVYMPGYSGLEVCEKVRGSMETMKTPVLLTVGKMEPYKSEDGNRVRADGVIVKPFEASDLLAIVKKFEERISHAPPPPPPLMQQRIAVDRFDQETEAAPVELPVEHPVANTAPQPTVDVPDHMATSSAFSDLLGTDSPDSVGTFNIAPSVSAYEPPPVREAVHAPVPDYELPVSWRREREEEPEVSQPFPAAVSQPLPATAAQETTIAEPVAPPPPARPLQIPVYQERDENASVYQFEPTSIPAPENIEIPEEPALLETAAETTRNTVADTTEPGLMTTRQQFEDVPASAPEVESVEPAAEEPLVAAGFQDIPADIVSHAPPVESAPDASHHEAAPAAPSEADFEARVAAALAAYSHTPSPPQAPEPAIATADVYPPQPVTETAPVETIATSEPTGELSAGAEQNIEQTAPEPPPVPFEYYPLVRETPAPAVEVPTASAEAEQLREAAPIEETHVATFEYQPVSPAVEVPVVQDHRPDVPAPVSLPEPESIPEADAPAATFEYHPPVAATVQAPIPEAEPFTAPPAATVHPTEAQPATVPAASTGHHGAVVAEVASAFPAEAVAAVAAETESGADHHSISQAVHRVMERLKPELVEEIMRELKSKK